MNINDSSMTYCHRHEDCLFKFIEPLLQKVFFFFLQIIRFQSFIQFAFFPTSTTTITQMIFSNFKCIYVHFDYSICSRNCNQTEKDDIKRNDKGDK